jgi:Rrf2 family iron-sulfur cluster assembly transcriptional regulator
MRLSTKGRYAVTSMLSLALHDQREAVTLADVSRNLGISLSYLEQLFAKLRKHHLVEGVRGPGGGYRLAKPLDQITVAQVITAVDERENEYDDATANKAHDQQALTRKLWSELSARFYKFLDSITLAELANGPEAREWAEVNNKRDAGQQMAKRSAA